MPTKRPDDRQRELMGPPETSPSASAEASEFILYQTEDGQTRIQIRLDAGAVWLSQAMIAELYQITSQAVNMHISAIYAEGELTPEATCNDYLQVRQEGPRRVQRRLKHYSLPIILAVGYRVRSSRGTQFRQWATAHLAEYLVKGFVLDDRRLKNPPGRGVPDYFDELLARIRDIRASEKLFYKKVLEIYATSVDYNPRAEVSQRFFATVQNKMHWAAHGHTAAEVIAARADADRPNMGLTTWAGDAPRRADIAVAKNYLRPDELEALNRIVTAYLEFAELQAMGRRPMYMADWIAKLDDFLRLSERDLLTHAGKISHESAVERATREFDRFEQRRRALPSPVEEHFDAAVREMRQLEKSRSRRGPRS